MTFYSESVLVHSNPSEIQGELGPHLLVVMALKILITVHDQHLYEPIDIKELKTIFGLKI
jgi:hypothetical protein